MEPFNHKVLLSSDEKPKAAADRVLVTYYTDPLCCWSWALEGEWKKFQENFQDIIHWKYVMGGMIQDWKSYSDPMNSISKPIQFGPVWMHASQISGVPMDSSIWHTDPPASSFPACIAVKCASLQSKVAEEKLLFALREAVMTRALNIAKDSVILDIAEQVSQDGDSELDLDLFKDAWVNGAGVERFTQDLQQTRYLRIGRYPTLTFSTAKSRGIMITGYRPYEILKDALHQIVKMN